MKPTVKCIFRISWSLLLFLPWFPVFSQQETKTSSDSSSNSTDTHFILSLDSRSTIIDRQHIRINGVLAGVGFGKKYHKITAGYYWLGYNASKRLIDWHKKLSHSINLSYYTKTDVEFISFAYWYPVLRNKKWILSIPVEMGVGQETAHFRQLTDDHFLYDGNYHFEPFQIGAYAEYHLSPWAGLSAQVGYRDAFSNGTFRKKFKGLYYSYGLAFYPDAIYHDLKKFWRKK